MDIIISSCKKDTDLIRNYAAFDKDINVVCTANTSKQTIQFFLEYNPDLLVLDTTTQNINALYVLSQLATYDSDIGHKVVLITDSNQIEIIDQNKFLRVIDKPITQDKVLGSLYKIKPAYQPKLTPKDVKKLFLNLKIELYSNGIRYLIEAIIMAAENHRLLQNLQEIYEKIGLKHEIPYDKVKWSIRSAVDTINKYADLDVFNSVFKYYDDTRALTPKYFIRLVLYYFDIDADE